MTETPTMGLSDLVFELERKYGRWLDDVETARYVRLFRPLSPEDKARAYDLITAQCREFPTPHEVRRTIAPLARVRCSRCRDGGLLTVFRELDGFGRPGQAVAVVAYIESAEYDWRGRRLSEEVGRCSCVAGSKRSNQYIVIPEHAR